MLRTQRTYISAVQARTFRHSIIYAESFLPLGACVEEPFRASVPNRGRFDTDSGSNYWLCSRIARQTSLGNNQSKCKIWPGPPRIMHS